MPFTKEEVFTVLVDVYPSANMDLLHGILYSGPEVDEILAEDIPTLHWLGQCAHESGGFTIYEENLNYSAKGLMDMFKEFKGKPALAAQYARQPQKIANFVYADKELGNRGPESGDGWRYRGMGIIQITGAENHKKYGPLNSMEDMWTASARYFLHRSMKAARANDFNAVTRSINARMHANDKRIAHFNRLAFAFGMADV